MHIIGSKTSSTKELLNAVNPQYALIGVGKDNKFGHPSEVTIQKLKEMNIKILRTDNMGEIVIKTNGTNNLPKDYQGYCVENLIWQNLR